MKTLSLMLIAVMLFTSVPVFACGGDKDKDPAPEVMCGGSGCDKDEEPAPEVMCGGDKDEEPAPAPDVMCGGDKDEEEEQIT